MKNPDPEPQSSRTDKVINIDEAVTFLQNLWTYTSLEAKCYAIVVVGQSGVAFKHFCLDEVGSYDALFSSVRQYLERSLLQWGRSGYHIYFQVLPLATRPERGRGGARDVKVGGWLWADLDYRSETERPEFEGCRELEDHTLECYYEDGGKWFHVKRPPLGQTIKSVKSRLGFEPTVVVDSGAGYHLYFRLSYEVDASRLKRLEEKLVDLLGADPQSKDLARVLRLPGTVNPRVGRLARVIRYEPLCDVNPEVLESKLVAHSSSKTSGKGRLRELGDADVLRIVELLRDAYRPGCRQSLLLYLSGWLAKAGVSPTSAIKIAKALYESNNDGDPLKTRLSAIVYSYKKAGVSMDAYAEEIEALTGVRPYGLEGEIREDEVKGKSGLQEVLEDVIGEERALAVIQELSEILGTLSPYRDSIIELMDYEKQLYAVANLRKLVTVRARRTGNSLVYRERVAVVAPTRVVVYDNPLGGVRKYEITFEGTTLKRPLLLGPALLEEIADRLRLEGLVYHSRLLNDVLSAVIQAFIRRGEAEVKTEIESPGFYLVDDRVVVVKYEVKEADKGGLRRALSLLNELAEVWFKRSQNKFATVIKWGIVAPFSYMLKQRGRWMPWLYLYGDSATGKTTLGRVVLKIWGLDSRHEKTGASVDTIARLGYVLSSSTFPVLVNEPGNALAKEEIVEAVKNAVDSTVARGKYIKGTYTEIPALAPLMFTSNRFLPQDDALLRRLYVITFSYGEKIPVERQWGFRERVEPHLGVLSEVGACVMGMMLESASSLLNAGDFLSLGEKLLTMCYELAGLEKPQWLSAVHEEPEDPVVAVVEDFTERLRELVNETYTRYIQKLVVEREGVVDVVPRGDLSIVDRLDVLLKNRLMSGMDLKDDRVMIKRVLLEKLGFERLSLKSLAEMIGCEYNPKYAERVEGKLVGAAVVICPYNMIKELLA